MHFSELNDLFTSAFHLQYRDTTNLVVKKFGKLIFSKPAVRRKMNTRKKSLTFLLFGRKPTNYLLRVYVRWFSSWEGISSHLNEILPYTGCQDYPLKSRPPPIP